LNRAFVARRPSVSGVTRVGNTAIVLQIISVIARSALAVGKSGFLRLAGLASVLGARAASEGATREVWLQLVSKVAFGAFVVGGPDALFTAREAEVVRELCVAGFDCVLGSHTSPSLTRRRGHIKAIPWVTGRALVVIVPGGLLPAGSTARPVEVDLAPILAALVVLGLEFTGMASQALIVRGPVLLLYACLADFSGYGVKTTGKWLALASVDKVAAVTI